MTDTEHDDGGPLFPPVKIGDEFNEEGYRVPVFSHGASVWCLFAAAAMTGIEASINNQAVIATTIRAAEREGVTFSDHVGEAAANRADSLVAQYRKRWPK